MTPLTPDEMRRAVRTVVADYESFVARGPAEEEDAKAFTARHVAARSALAHLEHLVKLAPGPAAPDQGTEVGTLIDAARRSIAMAAQEDGELPEDDDQG